MSKNHQMMTNRFGLKPSSLGLEPIRNIVLFLLTASLLSGDARADEPHDAALDGIWFCDVVNGYEAYRARRSVLVVRDNDFVIVTLTGVTKSTFSTVREDIDIERYDGRSQLGVYHIDGSVLHLSLGDAGGVRPAHYGHKRGEIQQVRSPHSHYQFTRVPTPEGLEILRTSLNDQHKRNVILAESIASSPR